MRLLGNGLEGDLDFRMQLAFLDHAHHAQFLQAGKNQVIGDHGQNQDLHVGEMPLQVLHQLQAIAVGRITGHVVIGDHNVDGLLLKQFDEARRTDRFADDLKTLVSLDEFTYPQKHDGVIVCNYHSECLHRGEP